jgi:rubrerythrin
MNKKSMLSFLNENVTNDNITVCNIDIDKNTFPDSTNYDLKIIVRKVKGLKTHYCKKCGYVVTKEKDKEIDYPFYCSNCDENLYSFEVFTD